MVDTTEKDIQNGVTRPRPGTTSASIWEICDGLAAGDRAVRKEVFAASDELQIKRSTAAAQFARWCKYNGLVTPREKKEAV